MTYCPPDGFYRLAEIRDKIKDGTCSDHEDLLILLFRHYRGPLVKSKLMAQAKSFFWSGFASSDYIRAAQAIEVSFNNLVAKGEVIYTKGKPLSLREDLSP
jgi:hypothetical protein